MQYLSDMESGLNVSGRRGARGYARLNNLRQRLGFLARIAEKRYGVTRITELSEKDIVQLFRDMREGVILRRDGKPYTSVPDYVNVFKAFWHWYQLVESQAGNEIKDMTRYVDERPVKERDFTYFTIEELRSLADQAKFKYKVLMWFLFDSGVRAPGELVNLRVSDLSTTPDGRFYLLYVRDEISKTFGRRFKLLLCSELLRSYVSEEGPDGSDYLFPVTPRVVNQYLQRLASRVWGDRITQGGRSSGKIIMYDFRHSSACYWRPRYNSSDSFKYRFGWIKDEMPN